MHPCCYQHIPPHPKGALFGWDMTTITEVTVMFLKQSCVHVKLHAAYIHLNKTNAVWPWRPHPDPVFSMSHYKPGFLSLCFFFSHPALVMAHIALFSCYLLTGLESPVWLQPIQFKVKWCALSEMSFCTLLLHWAVIYLWPVNLNKFCQSPLTAPMSHWSVNAESSKWHPAVLLCLNDHIPFIVSVLFCCEP